MPRSIKDGDSNNSLFIQMSNHTGTHVDAPYHFLEEGVTVDSYDINEWIFSSPIIIDIPRENAQIIEVSDFEEPLKEIKDADLLLIRTGFEKYRYKDNYWNDSPAFSPEIAHFLSKKLPSLSAVGFDTISLTSFKYREIGREAHKKFLGAKLRIFEDLSLSPIPLKRQLQMVIALPLIIEKADGAPCTIIGKLKIS